MMLTTADEPSSERMNPVKARPSAANAAAPSASVSTSETRCPGHGVDFSRCPRTKSDTAWSVYTIMIEMRTAVRYVAGGSGVPRIRLRIPVSRRATMISARPANAVFATPYASIPASSAHGAGRP